MMAGTARFALPTVVVMLALVPSAQAAPDRYFPGSFFSQPIPEHAPLDPESEQLSRELKNLAFGVDPATTYDCANAYRTAKHRWTAEEQASCEQIITRAGIASENAPVVYTVGEGQPRVPVAVDPGPAADRDPDLGRVLAEGVPIPTGAQPSPGSDHQLIIWQPTTDTMWEFWRTRTDAAGGWHVGWGGRIEDVAASPGHYRDVPVPGGGFDQRYNWGGPASSIPNLPGLITVEQLQSGVIGHALVFATWTNKHKEWVYPAQRSDGRCRHRGDYCSAIPQGARFRLDPDYDVSRLSHPIVRMIATAVQDYGMVLNNTTGGGVSLYTDGGSGARDLFVSADPKRPQPTAFMRDFPWEGLEMLMRGTTCTDKWVQCEQPLWWSFPLGDATPAVDPPESAPAPATCIASSSTGASTPGDDVIVGTELPDVLSGRGGDDEVCALSGDDLVQGDAGGDQLVGGNDDDELRGGADDDILDGGPGFDLCQGNSGTDTSRNCEINRGVENLVDGG